MPDTIRHPEYTPVMRYLGIRKPPTHLIQPGYTIIKINGVYYAHADCLASGSSEE